MKKEKSLNGRRVELGKVMKDGPAMELIEMNGTWK